METNRLNTEGEPVFLNVALRAALRKTLRDAGADPLNTKQMACVEAFIQANAGVRVPPETFPLILIFSVEAERDELAEAIKEAHPEIEIRTK